MSTTDTQQDTMLVALKLSSRLEVMQQSIDTLGCNLLFSFVVFSLLFLPVIKQKFSKKMHFLKKYMYL